MMALVNHHTLPLLKKLLDFLQVCQVFESFGACLDSGYGEQAWVPQHIPTLYEDEGRYGQPTRSFDDDHRLTRPDRMMHHASGACLAPQHGFGLVRHKLALY